MDGPGFPRIILFVGFGQAHQSAVQGSTEKLELRHPPRIMDIPEDELDLMIGWLALADQRLSSGKHRGPVCVFLIET